MVHNSSVCVLASGGMDSAVLLGLAMKTHRRVFPLFVRCGLSWESAEQHWLAKFLTAVHRPGIQPLTVISAQTRELYGSHWGVSGKHVPGYRSEDDAVYLPGRNILLMAQAAVFCALRGIREIHIGTLKNNPFPDGRAVFFRAAGIALSAGLGQKVSVRAPFLNLTKQQVVRLGRDLPLHLSFSCLNPRGTRPCGRCNKCAEKNKVLPVPRNHRK